MANKKNKSYKSADTFFNELLKDHEVRMLYEEEQAKSQLAAAVKVARTRAKLTQSQLAKKVKTSQSVIARLESGTDSRTPSLPLLARIAAACNGTLEVGVRFKKAG